MTAVLLLTLLADPTVVPLTYEPAGCGNPLQGLVPYDGDWAEENQRRGRRTFPHTLEFFYLPASDLAPEPGRFEFAALETKLDEIAGRGHQAIFRIFLEYPGRSDGTPKWLEEQGVSITRWRSPEATEAEEGVIATPDYADPKLRAFVREFIAALGERYDGDARVGFITAGLLGMWGEWHDYPRDELFASEEVQAEVLDAFEAAFSKTPILLRYPAGPDAWKKTQTTGRPFGYHDDSFAWATLPTGKNSDDWFFLHLMNEAGAEDTWQRHPIGGEIRPELWGKIFDAEPGQPKQAHRKAQDFRTCVEQTHVTWLMESGLLGRKQPKGEKGERRWNRALEEVARMGYEFHVAEVAHEQLDDGRQALAIRIKNTGVAPLYHDWGLVLAGGSGETRRQQPLEESLQLVQPGETRTFTTTLPADWPGGPLLLQLPNALPNGPPVRFANATHDLDETGWCTLLTGEEMTAAGSARGGQTNR